MKMLIVEPVEPLSLSSSPITGIELLSSVNPLPLPLPTTVAGALGACLGIELMSSDPIKGIEELVDKLLDRLRCREPLLLGPLTQFNAENRWSEPMVNIGWKLFANPKCISKELHIDTEKCEESGDLARFEAIIATGVSIERKVSPIGAMGEKKIKIGYLYKYPISVYKVIQASVAKPARPRFLYLLNCDEKIDGYVRFGGEGRIVKMYTRELEAVKGMEMPLNISKELYIALSPIPLLPIREEALYLDSQSMLGLNFVSEIIGIPQQSKEKPPKVVVENIGLGYYEVKRVRRPLILALPPGTIVKTKPINGAEDSLLASLYKIGFATLYPLAV